MSDLLDTAIDSLYEAFSDVSVPTTFNECACGLCVYEETFREMVAIPKREIPLEHLSGYAESTLVTCGAEHDYLYFLPRLLHANVIEESMAGSTPELTGTRIALLNMENWPQKRVQALEFFFERVIRWKLQNAHYDRIDDWQCAIAISGVSVSLYLNIVEIDPAAVLGYFRYNADDLRRGRLSNAYFKLPCPGHDEIVAWFKSEKIASILSSAVRI